MSVELKLESDSFMVQSEDPVRSTALLSPMGEMWNGFELAPGGCTKTSENWEFESCFGGEEDDGLKEV